MALVVLPTLTSYIAETFPLLHLTLVALEAVAFPALTSVTPFLACQICMEELYIHGGWDAVACDALECAAALLPADAKIPTWKLYKESLPTTPPSLLYAAKKSGKYFVHYGFTCRRYLKSRVSQYLHFALRAKWLINFCSKRVPTIHWQPLRFLIVFLSNGKLAKHRKIGQSQQVTRFIAMQIHEYSNTQIHKYANTQIQRQHRRVGHQQQVTGFM